MKVGFMTNAWGSIYGGGGGVTSLVDSYYISTGPETTAFPAIAKAGFEYVEIFEGTHGLYAKVVFHGDVHFAEQVMLKTCLSGKFFLCDVHCGEVFRYDF